RFREPRLQVLDPARLGYRVLVEEAHDVPPRQREPEVPELRSVRRRAAPDADPPAVPPKHLVRIGADRPGNHDPFEHRVPPPRERGKRTRETVGTPGRTDHDR